MVKKKKRLGKGLSALLNNDVEDFDLKQESNENNLISVNKITLSKFQARKKFDLDKLKELSESIEKNGLIQPVIVRKIKNNFELVAGERRLRACKLVGIDKIPVIISDFDDRKAFESGLIENLQREDLTVIEEAEGYHRLMNEFNYTQEELSKIVSKSRSHVANLLRLISLPKEVKKFILDGKLTLGHARCLVNYAGAVDLAKKIIKEDLSVRYVESLFNKEDLDKKIDDPDIKKNIKEKDADTAILEKELSLKLGVKLTINDKNNKGNIKIEYRNIDQRENILKKLTGG
ncbi:MAG: putative chromosome-partitioning protein ParB [Alphaproteobacteria bacterium MarineAlpha6_Bin6]|nr:chromosome partitioning protein [Pelagibacteraceae bacterium]PPR30234.1 MAG: putative chromosome-partitioning protein ParB [Alphaproteobacteria bacterium MarineAlpha6_Bin6]PPR33848.1 MAG: putative chromosome-partitioning protein ParB [Alphaproteobacteria bacterium MarineAlpha6_Bin5]|tara:strand:- start:1199 stop:2068 length:870 start_codon:yes stop_codon:yes gene_type:complete